ncbi:TIGR02679 family protein [Actinokineospora enzanensis]|uniref:TIGR02679 family protein n=1 Tax=Actinokineospora enzanensis TaxID=155975 RepID=UPI001FE01B62|nr:TIGR02679 family protein [Actinokineospora enzanensis]
MARGRALVEQGVHRLPDELAPVWAAVHRRLSTGRAVAGVRVGPLTEAQRTALADFLGADRLPEVKPYVTVRELDAATRAVAGLGVREVVAALLGPVGNRLERRAEITQLWQWLAEHPVVAGQPVLDEWAAAVKNGGLVNGSIEETRAGLTAALRVIEYLPADGVPLPVLAEQVLNDSHALDDGTRCSNLVVRALASIHGVDHPTDAHQRRVLWGLAGVNDDELSSTVLAAGLRPTGDSVAEAVLRLCADAGHAACLTLGQLRAAELAGVVGEVWIVENPSVLALALQRFGARCPQMVCVSGWPSGAGILLLRQLADAGCALRYHGDFDGEGIRIAAHVMARTGATPWRMDTQDYLAAVSTTGPSVGRVTEAPWDPTLASALTEHGITVSEERVAHVLLDEIGR